MHSNNVPTLDGVKYATEHEFLIVIIQLEEQAFKLDYGKVWLVIKDLTLRGPVYIYIST